ncbi:immunity 49 family protein [Kitasatospora sp. NPDC056181]|uniref:immunity 49 family protein n=1 Tax=Kitasatospora sp. NPDC056181 TaxID=3345737 RepID=UPI0035DAE217
MQEVTRHQVGEERIAAALEDIRGRAFGRWHGMRYDSLSLKRMRETGAELLDHAAACTLEDPALDAAPARLALRTAAECSLGVLSLGAFPDGDFEVVLPLVDQRLSSEDFAFGDAVDEAPTARTWVDAFAMAVITGLLREPARLVGPLLKEDYAPAIRDGVPYSRLESVSAAADLAEMDALCAYLPDLADTWPRSRIASEPLVRPDADARAEAARRLDAAGALTPDQRLLRVLLDDDRPAFEQALADRLRRHREEAGPDPEPRSLLPVGAIALAAVAVQACGWQPGLRSGYLPEGLLRP